MAETKAKYIEKMKTLQLVVQNQEQVGEIEQIQDLLRKCNGVYFSKKKKLTGSAKTSAGHMICESLGLSKPVTAPLSKDDTHGGIYIIWDWSKVKELFAGIEKNPIAILERLPELVHHALNVGMSDKDVIARANEATRISSNKKSKHPMQDFYAIPRPERKIKYTDTETGEDKIYDCSNIKGPQDLAVLLIGFEKGGKNIGLIEQLLHEYNENTSFHGMPFIIAPVSSPEEFANLGDKLLDVLIDARNSHIAGDLKYDSYKDFLEEALQEIVVNIGEAQMRESLKGNGNKLVNRVTESFGLPAIPIALTEET